MKIAICFYGKTGGWGGKDSEGIDPRLAAEHYQRNIIEPNNADVFIHSWSINHGDELIKLYQPRYCKFEKQIHFSNDFGTHIVRSRWYSTRESIQMAQGYDWIMSTRLDTAFFTPVNFANLNPGFIYAGHYNEPGTRIDYTYVPLPKEIRTRWFYFGMNIGRKKRGFIDQWFFGGGGLMQQFATLYENLHKYDLHSHRAAQQHIESFAEVKHVLWRGEDFKLIRKS